MASYIENRGEHIESADVFGLARFSRADVRRSDVISAARKLFIENGFHLTSTAQIANDCGIAVSQIYRDFRCKEDIIAAVVWLDFARIIELDALRKLIRTGHVAAVRQWLHRFIGPAGNADDTCLFAEIVAESLRNERIAAIVTTLQDELRGHLLAALSVLAPNEELNDRRTIIADLAITLSLGMKQHRGLQPNLSNPDLIRLVDTMINRDTGMLEQL